MQNMTGYFHEPMHACQLCDVALVPNIASIASGSGHDLSCAGWAGFFWASALCC